MTVDTSSVRALALGPESTPADHTIDITTRGARTGLSRRIEVWFHRVDGRWYLTGVPGPRAWYANILAHPRFIVHLKHGVRVDLPATGLAIVDLGARRHVFTEVLAMQDRPQTGGRGPRQYLDDWLAGSPLVEIVFDDEELRVAAATAS